VIYIILQVNLPRTVTNPLRNTTPSPSKPHLIPWYFTIPTYFTWSGIGISIGGYFAVSRRHSDPYMPTTYTKVGTGIHIALYLWTVYIFALLFQRHRAANTDAKSDNVRQPTVSVARCIPLVGVRVVYALLFVATKKKSVWHPVVGKWAVYLAMGALPELVVLAIVVATLVRIEPLAKEVVKDVESASESEAGVEVAALDAAKGGNARPHSAQRGYTWAINAQSS
jgi:hypothetical protein